MEELIRLARAGDPSARAELFGRSQSTLERWASRHRSRTLPGGARPSDIAQESGMRALRHFSTFQGTSEAEWFAWLERVSLSQLGELIRNAHRQKREDAGALPLDSPEALVARSPQPSPSQAAAYQEEWRKLLACIFQLPDDQRDAISRCHLEELPVAEVAKLMKRTEPAVAGLLRRGLRTLRTWMTESGESRVGAAPEEALLDDAAKAMLSYLRRRDAGEIMDPVAFAAEHPACEEELRSMLHWIERLQALRPASATSEERDR